MKGTWSVSEKRVKKNVENLVRFFSSEDKLGRPRDYIFKYFGPSKLHELIRFYANHQEALEQVFYYVRKFRQASNEITEEDIIEAEKLMDIKSVMES